MPHDALLDALLSARADEATPDELERAAALCRERADEVGLRLASCTHALTLCVACQARQALYAGVSLRYGTAGQGDSVASAAAALAAAATAGAIDGALGALAQQHSDAAASIAQLRASLEAALASAQLASAVEQGEALLRDGRCGAAALCVAAADAAAQALRAAGDAGPVLRAHERLRATLLEALGDALRKRITFELSDNAQAGKVNVRRSAEPLMAVWDGAAALGCAEVAAQELAAAAAPSAHAAVLCLDGLQAKREAVADGDALIWRAGSGEGASSPLLAFLGEAALGADAPVRHAFGAALCAAVGATAVTRVLAVGDSDALWEAELERATAFERAAAEHHMLAHASLPLSATLRAARADVRAVVQGQQLALVRSLALDTSHGATLVAGAWSGRVADMVGGQQPDSPPGVVCFPVCQVSGAAIALAGLLEERLRAGAYNDAADAADMLRACVPSAQADELAAAPGPAMHFRNSAHFLAFVLRNGAAAARAPVLQGVAAALCSAGDAVLAAAVCRAGTDAASALDLADGFVKAGEADQGAAVERALIGALHSMRRFRALACETLPGAVAAVASRAVLSAVGSRATEEILALSDIGVDDCAALASAFDAACATCDVPLDAEGWRKLARVRALLDAPLASIVAGAERGELRGLLSAREVSAFVQAVFCESALRAEALARIAATDD